MSSGEFTTIVNNNPDLTEELRKLQYYLSGLEVNQFFTAEQAVGFMSMDLARVQSLLTLVEPYEFIQEVSVYWCQNCEQPIEITEDKELTCDLCFKTTALKRDGYRL